MHRYLRSIGFSNIRDDYEFDEYLDRVVQDKNLVSVSSVPNGRSLEKYELNVANSMGISVVGRRDEKGRFIREYYFPFMRSSIHTMSRSAYIERHTERETYEGILEDFPSGITLIFYVSNSFEINNFRAVTPKINYTGAYLTGLAMDGKILFPLEKQENNEEIIRRKREQESLFERASEGDEDAIDIITETDFNLMSEISRRIETDDLYTLVESSFIPTGIECDQYNVLGEIVELRVKENTYTHENILDLTLKCNDVTFHVCINERDLIGVPAVGRRFKGRIWMQGEMLYMDDEFNYS